jgi:sulfur relay protein TusB/DsrH
MLHLIFELSDSVVLNRLHNQAGVIFLNNAVLRLVKNSIFQNTLIELLMTTPCYVLNDDLTLRGIEKNLLLDGITPIDYTKFVQLTVENTPIQTWI